MKLCIDIALIYMRQLCYVHSEIELFTCDLYSKLTDCSTWKESGLVQDFIQPLSCVIILDIVFGCYKAGRDLIIELTKQLFIGIAILNNLNNFV